MSVSSAVYEDLINWARTQLDYEAANGHPPVLGQAQRQALLNLHAMVRPPSPTAAAREPEIGSTNWVGLLHREFCVLLRHLHTILFSSLPLSFRSTSIRCFFTSYSANRSLWPCSHYHM